MNPIAYYLNEILAPRLRKYGVSESFIAHTVNTVRLQADSLLRHWDDRAFRSTVLLLGQEEGSFYEPAAKLEIRCFVVVTIRNSPIETIQSDACAEAGLEKPLPGAAVKEITSEAISYFSKQDFSALCRQAKSSSGRDIYGEIMREHPVAWGALNKLAVTSAKTVDYEKIEREVPFMPEGIPSQNGDGPAAGKFSKVILDGFDPAIDPTLAEMLSYLVLIQNGALIVDSFKALTRNVDKLFNVLEFLLSRGNVFATSNFYLENGHVERRVKPLRAGHTTKEMFDNLSQTSGLGHKHKTALNHYIKEAGAAR